MFIVRSSFMLNLIEGGLKSFSEGAIYSRSDFKGAEGTYIGETIKEVESYLSRAGYISELPTDMKELLKLLLRLR